MHCDRLVKLSFKFVQMNCSFLMPHFHIFFIKKCMNLKCKISFSIFFSRQNYLEIKKLDVFGDKLSTIYL